MEDSNNDFEKIRQLFATEVIENSLLGILLCQQLPTAYHQQWSALFQDINTTYQRIGRGRVEDPTSFELYQTSVIELILVLLPAFQQDHKAFHLADFCGVYWSIQEAFNTTVYPARFLEVEAYLQQALEPHDFAVFQLRKGSLQSFTKGTTLLLNLSSSRFILVGLPVLQVWTAVYSTFNHKNQFAKEEIRQWQPLAIQVLTYLKQQLPALLQAPSKTLNAFILALEELFSITSLTLLQGLQEKEILAQIVALISVPSFPKQARKNVLLAHALFQIHNDHLVEMSWRAMSNSNIYKGVEGEDVSLYANNFWQYQDQLSFETLPEEAQRHYQKAIFDLWAYYYVGALEPYLLFLNNYFQQEPASYFYLGQLYHGALKNSKKALYYFNQYAATNKAPLPPNNHILTERIYNQRCYTPSSPEAYTWIGQIQEENGEEQQAINTYRKAIASYPNYHLSPYLPLIKILLKNNPHDTEAYQLLGNYYTVFYETTVWNRKLSTHYYGSANLEVGPESKAWMAKYQHLVGADGDVQRIVGHQALILSCYYVFFHFAEWYFYEQLELDKALEALVFCNKCQTHLYGQRYNQQWPYFLETKEIQDEELIFLKAEIMLEKYQDYWQARSLYKQVLKLNPKHNSAKKGLQNIRKKLGY